MLCDFVFFALPFGIIMGADGGNGTCSEPRIVMVVMARVVSHVL